MDDSKWGTWGSTNVKHKIKRERTNRCELEHDYQVPQPTKDRKLHFKQHKTTYTQQANNKDSNITHQDLMNVCSTSRLNLIRDGWQRQHLSHRADNTTTNSWKNSQPVNLPVSRVFSRVFSRVSRERLWTLVNACELWCWTKNSRVCFTDEFKGDPWKMWMTCELSEAHVNNHETHTWILWHAKSSLTNKQPMYMCVKTPHGRASSEIVRKCKRETTEPQASKCVRCVWRKPGEC